MTDKTLAPDTTPAIERAAEAIEREDRTSDLDGHVLTRAMARAALTSALDVEEMTRALLPTLMSWWCGDHVDITPELDDDDEPLCEECLNARVVQATKQAEALRAAIVGGAE